MRRHHSRRSSVTLRDYAPQADWTAFRSAVSLHAHTSHSREVMVDLPNYISQLPIIAGLFERELQESATASGRAVDFSKGWWHPPVSPRDVFESESHQIERRFGLHALVSVTDHDNIDAGFELQQRYASDCAPVSCEWTVPYGDDYFHLGVHNLPPRGAREWFGRLAACTARTGSESAHALLQDLARIDGLLLVLNHPLWDLAGVGAGLHLARLRAFLEQYRGLIHAVELNGFRSRKENGGVRTLSIECGLPLVSGGDRHARAPNAMVNVTPTATFAEFADEVRGGTSHVVIMPEYHRNLAGRKLAAASEVLRRYRGHPAGTQRWFDRVSCEFRGKVRPLSHYWPTGGPLWVRSAVALFRVVTSPLILPLFQAALERFTDSRDVWLVPKAAPIEMSAGVFRLGLE